MLLIGNGKLITRNGKNDFYEDGCVAISETFITEVGNTHDLTKKYPQAEFIDARGGIIMPGLINMHNHIYSAFARGLSIKGNHPQNFMDILKDQWWKIDQTLNLKDCYHSAMTSYLDAIKNGVTTVFDHHASYGETEGSLVELSRAAKKLGVRTCLCYEVSDRHGKEAMKKAVQENVAFSRQVSKERHDMQKAMFGLHAAFTLSNESLEYCASNKPADIGYHIHVAEGMTDVFHSKKEHHKAVVNRLYDFDILGEKTMAAHCIHINPYEMELLRDTNTMVVTNPESNMGNAVGCPPAIQLLNKYQLLIGLGTDGYTQDMTESYKVANLIHKHHLGDPNVGWIEIPEMLFNNNARMANRYFEKKLGMLEKNAAADVIVLDYKSPTPITKENLNGHILFGVNGRQVTDTIINGEVKMKNREIIGLDEEKIWYDAKEQSQAFFERINK
ncbi:putative aminohydrolase SsnA [Listeria sp. PSOL-1]|uniref:putative aminohydrolase SsnA n=1 Tax=Listeria sp. PSOL-1 TaxID=1844999 RepID=UPI0013D37595|nr:putative aminohydrolase SsnA [Listeria sp. PSOL-1]